MPHPLLYEINTRCWLRELSDQAGEPITLANVPDFQFAAWQKLGFTHLWLMGVWTTGPRARAEALNHPGLRAACDQILPGWTEADITGSPYAVADYQVPDTLGGEAGLATFRQKLHAHGIKLVLDFIPNHLGLDHPWLSERPHLFVQSPSQLPEIFPQETIVGLRWLAHGKDPYFPAWTDTAQLDYRLSDTYDAMIELLERIAERCDGVRCDMAMLVLNDIFVKTWERFPIADQPPADPRPSAMDHRPPTPSSDFWGCAIFTIKQSHPDFLFLAEAYWGLEPVLKAVGFDYTYDKTLYDRLIARDAAGVQAHLLGLPPDCLAAGAHFLENHDERRIASLLSPAEHRAAALLILALPGMRFLHQCQLRGARLHIPIQLLRRPAESGDPEIETMYEQLLTALPSTAIGQGEAELLHPRPAWQGNPTFRNFVIIQWQAQPPDFDLVVVNLAPYPSQCYVPLDTANLQADNWSLKDVLGDQHFERPSADLQTKGLYLDLPPHAAQ